MIDILENHLLQDRIVNKVEILSEYFTKYSLKDREKGEKIIFHSYRIDLSLFPDNQSRFIFLEHLLDLIELIWSDKRFSRLIADIAECIAYTIAFNTEQDHINGEDFNNMVSKFSYNCDIALKHLGFCVNEHASTNGYSDGNKTGYQCIFKYSELNQFIDRLEILGINTRRYFYYDGASAFLGASHRLAIMEGIMNDIEIVEKIQSEKLKVLSDIISKDNNGTEKSYDGAIQYFTMPLWRFFIIQFLTSGFYGLYWSYKNLRSIGEANGKIYSAGKLGISILGPYKSILGHFWKTKPLIGMVSLFLNILLIFWPILQFGILQNHKIGADHTDYQYILGGIFTLPRLISDIENLGEGDPLKIIGLYFLSISALCLFFFIISFPVIIAQHYAKKYHKKKGLQEFTAKFSYFEGIAYVVAIGVIYLGFSGGLAGIVSPEKTINSQIGNSKNEELVWKEYKSNSGSFIVLNPGLIKYSRQKNYQNNVDIVIDTYESNLLDIDTIFIITHAQFNGEINLNGKSVKEMYKIFLSSYKLVEEIEYKEVNGEAHYVTKIEYNSDFFYIQGRIIKNNDNELYNIYSFSSDLGNKEFAEKFIKSFTLIKKEGGFYK